MSKLIDLLWSGRDRRPNPVLQERLAWYSLFRPHPARDVQAAPQRPPSSIVYCNHPDRAWVDGSWIDGRLVCPTCTAKDA